MYILSKDRKRKGEEKEREIHRNFWAKKTEGEKKERSEGIKVKTDNEIERKYQNSLKENSFHQRHTQNNFAREYFSLKICTRLF